MTVAGLLLAAGAGRRYGMPKALVTDAGRLLVERALATLVGGGCDPVIVVLGAAADEVLAQADLTGATVVVNPDWDSGMGSSLRAGLAALDAPAPGPAAPGLAAPNLAAPNLAAPGPAGPDLAASAVPDRVGGAARVAAACVLLVDTPGITAGAVRRVAGLAAPGALAVATYHGEPGHPVLLGRDHWSAVAELAIGDVGARRYLVRHPDLVTSVPCEDIAVGEDLDVPPPPP